MLGAALIVFASCASCASCGGGGADSVGNWVSEWWWWRLKRGGDRGI